MKISVIIPTYNRKYFVCRAIDSVIEQCTKADEIIVVDDGSTDDTDRMVKKLFPQVHYIYQKNQGVSSARNVGIDTARNPWIAFLDSDDRWFENKLKIQMAGLKKNPEYKISHGNEIWIKNGVKINQRKKHQKRGGYIFNYCLPLCVISPSSVIIHRDVFAEIGLFDESLPACEDYDLWLRICSKYPVYYTDKPIVEKYGGHNDQLSARYWGMDRFRIRALKNLLYSEKLTREQEELTRRALKTKLSIYLVGAKKHNNLSAEQEFTSLVNLLY